MPARSDCRELRLVPEALSSLYACRLAFAIYHGHGSCVRKSSKATTAHHSVVLWKKSDWRTGIVLVA
jgi:hypothetical protein